MRKRCHTCKQLTNAPQTVSQSAEGAYRIWTPARAAWFKQQRKKPQLYVLCPTCYKTIQEGGDTHG